MAKNLTFDLQYFYQSEILNYSTHSKPNMLTLTYAKNHNLKQGV